jgi:glycosyltransferase involved in cell wall biosynthesis
MKLPLIAYIASRYMSFSRVAMMYRNILASERLLIDDVEKSTIVILHGSPEDYESILHNHNALKNKYVIGYCVWEATDLPGAFKRSLHKIDEIWTCSRYCLGIFSRYHPKVTYIPHVVDRDCAYADADSRFIFSRVNYERNCLYFLMIAKVRDKRKNVLALVRAFQGLSREMPNARLVIKGTAEDLPLDAADPRIICIR